MSAQRGFVIAGAGVAGLSLALGLAKFGARVTVIERSSEISAFGAGLQISPNARKALDQLGIGPAIDEASFAPEGIDVYSGARAAPVQTLILGETIAARFGAPYTVMHRGDLVGVLHAAAKKFANVDIVTGVESFALDTGNGRVAVEFREAGGTKRRAKPSAFIGADGVNSATRAQVLGGPKANYSGKVAWRALAAPEPLSNIFDLTRTSLMLGRRFHLVVYPLPHRQVVNLALFTNEVERDLEAAAVRAAPTIKPGRNARLKAVLDAVGANWTPWVLSTVHTGTWHEGSVGLIGDAAHAMLPFQAQGAAMALEDAATLAPLLAASPSAEHAFSRFEALRRPRIERVQRLSEQNGRIFHMPWPISLARNLVIGVQGHAGHMKRLDWLYGYTPGGG